VYSNLDPIMLHPREP